MFNFFYNKNKIEPILNKDGGLFKVPLTRIRKVENHPNADRLSVYTVYGFKVIGGLNQFREGDLVYYIPIDAVIPKWLEDIVFKDSKIQPHNGRIRQIKIRQFYS